METRLDIEELKDEKDMGRRHMLLQKYGVIPPMLTEWEKEIIILEAEVKAVFGSDFRLGTWEDLIKRAQ